jgi:hypothetical protein
MSLIAIVLFFLFPILVLAAAAGLGVGTAAFFYPSPPGAKGAGKPPRWPKDWDEFRMALTLAIGITVVAAAAVLIARYDEFGKVYGPFLEYLWLWALGAFSVGLIFGWGSCRQTRDR